MQNNQSLNSNEASLHAIDYWQILKNRYGIILLTFILVVLTAAVITYVMPRKYMSSAVIEIKPIGTKTEATVGRSSGSARMSRQFYQTEFAKIESEENLKNAAIRCQLAEKWKVSLDQATTMLKGSLKTRQQRSTDLIEISVTNGKREDVKDIAEAIADSYRDTRVNEEEKRLKESTYELEKKIQAQEDVVTDHRNRLAAMSEKTGIPYTGLASSQGAGSPAELAFRRIQEQLEVAKKDRDGLAIKVKRIQELDDDSLPGYVASLQMSESTVISGVYEQYEEAKKSRGSLIASGLGYKHPRVAMLDSQIAASKKQLDTRVIQVRDILKDRLEFSKKEVASLANDMEQKQGKRIITASDQTLFNALAQEYEQARQVLSTIKINLVDENLKDNLLMEPIKYSQVPREPEVNDYVSPNWVMNMGLGAVAGIIFGIGIAFALELMDTSVKSLEDVERYLQVPVLAVIPKDVGVLHKQSGASPDAEAYRILRTNIEFNRKNPDDNSITVVSGGAGEGKSTTLVNLAYICAQGGYSTLMIDADLRRPRLHTFFDINNTVGLTNYLTTDLMLEDVILQTPIDNLFFMPSGILPADAAGILNSRRMSELVQDVKHRFDLVLIDSPPILGVSDASVLASEVDLTMIVVQHRKLPRKMLIRVKQAVESVGGTVLGVVLNNVDVRSDSQYQYYTSYYTYYAPTEPEKENLPVKQKEVTKVSSNQVEDSTDLY